MILVLILTITACATVREISDIQALVEHGFTDMSDDELQAIEQRPLPAQPGINLDLALSRRSIAAGLRGNMPVLRETAALARSLGTNEDLILGTLGMEADTEWTNGNENLAFRQFAEIEKRLISRATKERTSVYASQAARGQLSSYLFRLSNAMNFPLADRLVKDYFLPAVKDSTLKPDARFYVQLYLEDYQIMKMLLEGDPEGAYNAWLLAISENDKQVNKFGLSGESIRKIWENKKTDYQLKAGLAALATGRMDAAFQQLRTLEGLKSPVIGLAVADLKSEILWYARDYQAGYEHLLERRRHAPPVVRRMAAFRAAGDIKEAQYLLVLGRWEDAERVLNTMQLDGVISANKALRTGMLAFTEAHLGREPSNLKEFQSFEPVYKQQQRGIDGSIYYYAAKVYIFAKRTGKTGAIADLKKAIDGGRRLSQLLKTARITGIQSNVQTSLPDAILDMSKQAYLKVASQGVERGVASYDDLLDALQLIQVSKTDRDISAMSNRLTQPDATIARLLKSVQDARKKMRSTQNRLAALVRTRDADNQDIERASSKAKAAYSELSSHLGRLNQAAPQVAQLLGTEHSLRLRDIQKCLGKKEVLVSIGSMEDSTLVAVMTRKRARYHQVKIPKAELEGLVERVRYGVTLDVQRGIPAFDTEASHQLYKRLLHWARSSLSGKSTLYVSTNGALASVPFGLLLKSLPQQRCFN